MAGFDQSPDQTPQSSVEALQAAVIARLKADQRVSALVSSNVFDEVPSDRARPTPPYVYFGGINRRLPAEQGICSSVKQVTFRLFAVSTDFGRMQAWAVIEACTDALHNKEITLAGPYRTLGDVVKLVADGDVIQPVNPKSTFADFTVAVMSTAS